MDQICLVVPVLPGKTADARDFMRELEADRNADYQASEQRIGIVKEAWYLARAGAGDQRHRPGPEHPPGQPAARAAVQLRGLAARGRPASGERFVRLRFTPTG